FSLAEHYQEDSQDALEGVVVSVSPPLTPAEEAALRLVPANQRVQNVGAAIGCKTTWLAAAIWVVTHIVTATAAIVCAVRPGEEPHLPDGRLNELSPAASARELLAVRRELLTKNLAESNKSS